MGLENLKAGDSIPDNMNVVIEIASNSSPIKYEIDKISGLVNVDRFLTTAMAYPCEYGFIPCTLSEDGDPVDVLVMSPFPLMPSCIIKCRPIGMLCMTDEAGKDTKILAVPVSKLTTRYASVNAPVDLGKNVLSTIEHFFKHYKDLEEDKWTRIDGWQDVQKARAEILAGVERFQKKTA